MTSEENIYKSNSLNSDDIDFKELGTALWEGRLITLIITFVLIVFSILFALSIPNKYQSSALLVANESNASSNPISGINSALGGAAGMLGVDISSGSYSKSDYAIATINSKEFFKHLSSKYRVLPNLYAAKNFDFKNNEIIYEDSDFNSSTEKWVRNPPRGRGIIPSYLEVYPVYTENLKIKKNNSNGFISISYEHVSPVFASEFISLVINEVNNITRIKDLERSISSLKYLEEKAATTRQREVSLSISQLMEAEIRTQMLSNIDDYYLLRPIDDSYVPEARSSPNRRVIVIISTLIGIFIGSFISLLKYFYKKNYK